MTSLPDTLISAVREQRAVLFLGAGASQGATHPEGNSIPMGNGLRDLICDQFLQGKLKNRPLSAVSAMVSSEIGFTEFQSFLHQLFEPFGPAEHHLLIPTFRWRAIVTTNFDIILEKTYSDVTKPLQTLVKSVKDGDSLDQRLRKEINPVDFYKLHGCIEHYHDSEIPIIISNEQYSSYKRNRARFYNRFTDLGYEYPIIFVGYSISDQHIQNILFELTDPSVGRPSYFLVSPDIEDIETRYWQSHRVITIKKTFDDFLNELNNEVPPASRQIPIELGGGTLSIRAHYRKPGVSEQPLLEKYLSQAATHIHSALVAPRQDPKKFYHGYDEGWGCILQNLDVRRNLSDSVLVDAILRSDEDRKIAELFVLKGPGGNGKTVVLKRVAWEAGSSYDQLALYVDNAAGLQFEALDEIYRLTGKRVFLFVDRLALVRDPLRDLLRAAQTKRVPITVIGAERNNEWNIYCEQLEPFVRQDFPVRYLSHKEIDQLIDLLEKHGSLGWLESQSSEARIEAFSERAGRQLLVALHEVTLGIPFEDIVADEYRRIEPAAARNIYLNICTLHQFGASIRAGLISRISGISFERFQQELLGPLDNVVRVTHDRRGLDVFYASRHQHVAELVFNRVLSDPESKFDQLVGILGAINIDYSSDEETFSRLIRGRQIAEMFPNPELGRLFYDRLQDAIPRNSFVYHQRSVFEMQHHSGSLELAEQAAKCASDLNPGSHSIQHTRAEIARRRANETSDPLQKQAFRLHARRRLRGESQRPTSYDWHTRARLAVDEVQEALDEFSRSEEEVMPSALVQTIKEAEIALQRGLQLFPESSELLTTEATFRDQLNQTSRAQQALERAFYLNPRQDWLARRLARRYADSGNISRSIEILEACLQDNPGSKIVHLEIGRIASVRKESEKALQHLKRGFTVGDDNFEGRFWCARELFLQGHQEEAQKLFADIHSRAPVRYRTGGGARVEENGIGMSYKGRVKRWEEGYAFIFLEDFAQDVFASRAESEAANWDGLHANARVECELAFSRRGGRAVSVCLAPI